MLSANNMPTVDKDDAIEDGVVDYRALYLQEAEKNKQLLQWIVQLQSNLSLRLQETTSTSSATPSKGPNKMESKSPSTSAKDGVAKPTTTGAGDSDMGQLSNKPEKMDDREKMEWKEESGRRSESGSQERVLSGFSNNSTGAHQHDAGGGGGDLARLVSKVNSSSNSESPNLSHRGSAANGQENMMRAPEMAIDLARTTCAKCGQCFAFCTAFLSRHDFLVMPCPKCRAAAAIPPTPLAPTPNASATRPAQWQDTASHAVTRDSFL